MYRFAPSPTGDMHIGNLRAAIFNYIRSLQDKSGFILRIEDTDTARNIEGKDKDIMEILTLFGIKWQTLYYQSKNLKFHQEFAAKLLQEGKAFCCFCSEEELAAKKEKAKEKGVAYRYDGTCEHLSDAEVIDNPKPFTIRLKKPTRVLKFTDAIKGEISFEPENIDSFVIMRADKTPTYNFACATDDMLEGVTFVIRGEDHVSNTPKQNWIRECLGYTDEISYAHLPIILGPDGKKMSKRDDASSVKWMLDTGFLPEAIANYLVLLGNKTPCEVFSIEEAVEFFDIAKISKAPAKFDIDKLAFINREHIKRASAERICELFGVDESKVELVKFYTQESSLIPEIKAKISAIFSQKEIPSEFSQNAEILRNEILNLTQIPAEFSELKTILMEKTALKGKAFFMPLRLLLTGAPHGPELGELYPLIKSSIKEILNASK
ncbi:glutamate--tRNA ligase [Campylobacter sp. VBCF_06 NA8]|uniref:glutamate--tRNA ligase n=1 Tax=Campylobacter sp. VBCF_06 NA8 TaxID=2983822 RepID=UPI0022E9BEBF|nr:glutamate--tRNA ligase [Campylobacter sp. VBCF_06 NA8]MDA3046095.1 glutamate--tRNA ligase [Campylobacter sp. VBCF_06 NA8]